MINMEIHETLEREYLDTLEEIKLVKQGSDEAKWLLAKLAELHKQLMNEETTINDATVKYQQDMNNRYDRIVKIVLEGSAILVPCIVSSYWMARGLMFEETGSFSSSVEKWVSGHLRLFKK